MAFNFPDGASNGQTHTASNGTVYRYDGNKWIVDSAATTTTFDSKYLNTNGDGIVSGSVLRTLGGTNVVSSSTQVTTLLPDGVFSGSLIGGSNVTVTSGSGNITIASSGGGSVPAGTISSSAQIAGLGYSTTGSNTFIGTETISGSLLLSGSFNYNGTPLQNGFSFAQPTLTRILDNVSYTNSSAWTAAYTGSGGAIIVTANVSGFRSTVGIGTAQLLRDSVAVASQTFYFNLANTHTAITPITYVRNSETGSHTYAISFSNILADANDYATINVLEYGNSAVVPAGTISGSSQLTSSYDTRYLNVNGDGVVSGSSQITDGSGILSGSVAAQLPTGTVSGSTQITNGSNIISGSTQIANLGYVSSSTVDTIQVMTTASYAAITPVSGTLYIIQG